MQKKQVTEVQKTPTLSVCMIVKNEAKNLPRLLDSIKGLADEVIIVDTGSTDNTVEIAQRYGAKTYYFEWNDDFSAARNESLKFATKDYILWLDGDDEIEKDEHYKIKEHMKKHFGSAIYLKLRNAHATEETEATQLRMFPNHKGILFSGRVHEQVFFCIQEKGIPFSTCYGTIIHHGYEESSETVEKLNRNKKIQEKELIENPDSIYTYFYLARTHKGLGQFEEALENYLIFIERGKDKPETTGLDIYKIAILEASQMLGSVRQVKDAIDLLETWRKRFPLFRLFNFMLGQIYFHMKNYERTYNELLPLRGYSFDKECLPIDVNATSAIFNQYLGISSLFTHDYITAVEYLKKSVETEPGNSENYHYLSLAFEKSGDIERAIEVCSNGLDMEDSDSYLKKRRFHLFVKKGDFERALWEFERLNGCGNDIDVLGAMLLINCMALNLSGINHFYSLMQGALSVPAQSFPEGIEKVKETLLASDEFQAAELFESAISHLLKINS
jgi:glycosyltransferase involved in cell wall biosynthesis